MKHYANFWRRIFSAAALLVSLSVGAQKTVNIVWSVEDAFLHRPLTGAHVAIVEADSATVVVDTATVMHIYDERGLIKAHYYASVPARTGDYLLHARLQGYADVWQKFSVTDPGQKKIELPTLKMRRQSVRQLPGAGVVATRIKMFHRGDTLVYDATAFQLPDGSMLDDLIRQMPGVELTASGEIFVNGRKVDELLLGSRSFMRGNKKVLLENLPYYTVKHIKVYDKRTELSEAMGRDVEPRKYVMDVNLKPEYQRGAIANIEGALGTEGRWLDRAFLLGFTAQTRYTLLGNANNVNEARHVGEHGHWTPQQMPRELRTSRSVQGEVDYQAPSKTWRNVLTAECFSSAAATETSQRKETFLPGLTLWSESQARTSSGNRGLRLDNRFTLRKPTYAWVHVYASSRRMDGRSASAMDQYDDSLAVLQRTRGLSDGRMASVGVDGTATVKLRNEKLDLLVWGDARYEENTSRSASHYLTEQRVAALRSEQYNTTDASNRHRAAEFTARFSVKLPKDGEFFMRNQVAYDQRSVHDFLYHPDTLTLASRRDGLLAMTDPADSYDSRQTELRNVLSLGFMKWLVGNVAGFSTGYPKWRVGVDLPLLAQRLDYARGTLDTLARQTRFFVNPYLSYRAPLSQSVEMETDARLRSEAPQLMDRISYRDTRQPLLILQGNPDLKSLVRSQLSLTLRNNTRRKSLPAGKPRRTKQWNVGAEGEYVHRDVAQSVCYDPATGVYIYRPRNIGGAWTATLKGGVTRNIDPQGLWTWETCADARLHHALDHVMRAGQDESRPNAVDNLTLHDNVYLQFAKKALSLRATADVRMRHAWGRMQDFATLHALDYSTGLSGRCTLPASQTTLTLDACLYGRSGYGSAGLNASDFVLNASISQPLLRKKLIARLEAFDLLHQLSTVQYEVSAQGRVETWYRSLPHYVMLHLVYHFNKMPSRKP